jgi:hypothetical protein
VPSEVEAGYCRGVRGAPATLLLMALLMTSTTAALGEPFAGGQGQPTDEQIHAAVAKLNADPNLGGVKKSYRLQWKQKHDAASKPDESPSSNEWLRWIAEAINWFATTARALLWVMGVLLAGVLGLYIKRFLELRGSGPSALRLATPTHVRDLDIRPESLPPDIGATAFEMWERSDRRAALALLYRGALSRLAHVHNVPIRDSSTEGDCLRLASSHLPTGPAAYVARLIRVWQRAVYGNSDPTGEEVHSLCTQFSDALDEPVSTPAEQAA